MSRPRKTFLFFLVDTPTGKSYSFTNGSVILNNNVTPLQHQPDTWRDIQLTFGRNTHYFGLNRSFSSTLKFVEDGASIIRYLLYKYGIEKPLSVVILKWNDQSDVYEDYYKGMIDLSQCEDDALTGVTVTLLEGGLVGLLKSFENTVFTFPCDGSIDENIKVKIDGILFDDVFHYNIIPVENFNTNINILPCVFTGNDGDNIGILRGNPTLEDTGGTADDTVNYLKSSANFLFSTDEDIDITISGNITLKANSDPIAFRLEMLTSETLNVPPLSPAEFLVPNVNNQSVTIKNFEQNYTFEKTMHIPANVNLFLAWSSINLVPGGDNRCQIVNGTFNIAFSSKYKVTTVWGIPARDLFKLIIQNICKQATTTEQLFNYSTVSELLDSLPNIICTSGDAIRASGDPLYAKYFNPVQQLNGQTINNYSTFGPVIRTSLSDFFDAMNAIYGCSLGVEPDDNGVQVIFIENKKKVFDSSLIDMNLGEVSLFTPSVSKDYVFNMLKIGYPNQTYDEKAGKFEYNTTAQYQAPIKLVPKELDIICKYRTDSYGIEYTRFNATKDSKSQTYNNNDTSVFLIDADRSQFEYDFDELLSNTSQLMLSNRLEQGINLSQTLGSYLQPRTDNSIFIFNQSSTATVNINVTYAGVINGKPGQSTKIQMFLNGLVVDERSYIIVAPNQEIGGSSLGDSFVISHAFSEGDVIYFKVFNDPTVEVVFSGNTVMNINSGYYIASIIGTQTVPGGASHSLLILDQITGTFINPGPNQYLAFTSGIQFFFFNEVLAHPNFNVKWNYAGSFTGSGNVLMKLYVNGIDVEASNHNVTPFTFTVNFNQDFHFGDLVFTTLSADGAITPTLSGMVILFTSTQIQIYPLTRKPYDAILGIPNPSTAYNLEFSPKRMLINNGNFISSSLYQQRDRSLTFLQLDRNQSLSTTAGLSTITENADMYLSDLDNPIFIPFIFKFTTTIPRNFVDIMTDAANAHIQFSYSGKTFYGYPIKVTQKPALEETQEWELLASDINDLSLLYDLNIDGLNFSNMADQQFGVIISHLSPVQFVPMNQVFDPRYNFIHMDQDWFINQIQRYISKKNYFQKWQLNDTINLQVITKNLGPVHVDILKCSGQTVAGYDFTQIITPALQAPFFLYQVSIPLAALLEGTYYMILTIGMGSATIQMVSEGLDIKTIHPFTSLFDYTNDKNKQSVIFSDADGNTYSPNFRVECNIVNFNPDANLAYYEDDTADMQILKGFPFRKFTLEIPLVPPYVIDKINRIMLLGTVLIDGFQYARDGNEKLSQTRYDGSALTYWTLAIREAINQEAININSDGEVDNNLFAVYNIETKMFGDMQSQVNSNIVQIEELDD